MRIAVADESLLNYLSNIARQAKFSVGLILGQQCQGKDYVIHFAKTPPLSSGTSEEPAKVLKCVTDVNESWVGDHARIATRMMPGGMYVLGMFVVSQDDLISPLHPKIKASLVQIHKHLESNKYLYGNFSSEKLVLNFNCNTNKYICKSYDVSSTNLATADIKFVSQNWRWMQFDCFYLLDYIYNIIPKELESPLKEHVDVILDAIYDILSNAAYLYDGLQKHDTDAVDTIHKKMPKSSRSHKSSKEEQDIKPIAVSIYQNCNSGAPTYNVMESGGQINVLGHVATKLWLHPKLPISEARKSIIHDIMRSLSARLEMHWDSLTEEEHAEDINSIHEPPRRVIVAHPKNDVMLSDYIFPGEGPEDAKTTLEEMLDIKIKDNSDITDIEGQAETTQYLTDNLETESEESLPKIPESNYFMYIIGLSVALLVLIISMFVHFYNNSYLN